MDLSLEKCWVFAKNSKGEIRFGAFLEKYGRIIGFGWNRQSTPKDRNLSLKIFGQKVDYCIHAEEMALINAVLKKINPNGSVLYVAGFLKDESPIRKKKAFFICPRCAKRVLLPFNISVRVPTLSGWQELSPEEAYQISLKFQNSGFWQKIAKNSKRRKK